MTTYPWRAALTRWGDALFRLALLLTDDRTTAERAVIQAFMRSFATPNEDLETALYAALLHDRPGRRNPLRRRKLPRALDRIAPPDRVLLGAWLLRDIDGPRLLTIAGQSAEIVLPRMAAAILSLVDSQDPAHSDQASRVQFDHWLRRRLGLAPATAMNTAAYDPAQTTEWQSAIDELRQTLREAVGRQHLPPTCVELIETNMLDPQVEQHWWRQRAALIGAAVVVLALLWIIKPWQQGLGGPAGAVLTSKELVQKTLDGWTTSPVTGTLHHKVVAIVPWLGQRALTADVWLSAGSAQHRVEVRNDTTLIEWQIGDGNHHLSYAAFPRSSSCEWAIETSALDQTARTFTLPPEQERAARDAALTRGAYGQGYLALQAALSAPDLRSFGTRIEDKTTLLVLGYTDRQTKPERKLLLWIDPAKNTLHAVREVASAGGQADARDLWRLQASEALTTKLSVVPPSWPGTALKRDQLLDPHCPGLDPEHIVSLRSFVSSRWWGYQQWYLPATAPEDTSFAAMVTPSSVAASALNNNLVSAIFVGSNRWLSLQVVPRDTSPSNGIERGSWRVSFRQETETLRGSACRRFTDARNGFCIPSVEFAAHGWTQEELLALIDSFRPIDGQSWLNYNDLFLDPQPLTPETQAIVEDSIVAIQQLKQGSLYSVAERTARVNPERPSYHDPYHVPLDLTYPEHSVHEQWLVYANNRVSQYLDLTKHPRGDVMAVQLNDGKQYNQYYLPTGALWQSTEQAQMEFAPTPAWTGEELLSSLIASQEPITARKDNDRWLLEQALNEQPNQDGWFDDRYLNLFGLLGWIEDLTMRRFVRRVWIDAATALPVQTAIVQRDVQGAETAIVTITISVRPQHEPFSQRTFSLPAMPDDTIAYQSDSSSETPLLESSLPITLPTKALVWNTSGIGAAAQIGTFNPAVFAASDRSGTISRAVGTSVTDLDQIGLIQTTAYQFPQNQPRVVVRQGPRNLMRHILRYQSVLTQDRVETWTASKALSATIAGQERTVWLLQTRSEAMLVFEIDDLLVHIVGPDPETLEQTVLPALAKLEWASTSR